VECMPRWHGQRGLTSTSEVKIIPIDIHNQPEFGLAIGEVAHLVAVQRSRGGGFFVGGGGESRGGSHRACWLGVRLVSGMKKVQELYT
jgi:hypothetical protein